MIAKGLLLLCLASLSCATFLKKRQLTVVQPLPSLHTAPLLFKQELPQVHEYFPNPIIHRVHQDVHINKYIQPVVHHFYRQPLIRHTVEPPVVPHEEIVQPLPPIPELDQAQAVAHAEVAV